MPGKPFAFVLLAHAVLALPALAQSVPAGACLLDDGRWCWPVPPTSWGEECTCETPEGPLVGLTQ